MRDPIEAAQAHVPDPLEEAQIRAKKTVLNHGKAPWHDHELCCSLLYREIKVRKYNYSNKGVGTVFLGLTADRQALTY